MSVSNKRPISAVANPDEVDKKKSISLPIATSVALPYNKEKLLANANLTLALHCRDGNGLAFARVGSMPNDELANFVLDIIQDSTVAGIDATTLIPVLWWTVDYTGERLVPSNAYYLIEALAKFVQHKDLLEQHGIYIEVEDKTEYTHEEMVAMQNHLYWAVKVLEKSGEDWGLIFPSHEMCEIDGPTHASLNVQRVMVVDEYYSRHSGSCYGFLSSNCEKLTPSGPERAVLLLYDWNDSVELDEYVGGGFRVIRESEVPLAYRGQFTMLCTTPLHRITKSQQKHVAAVEKCMLLCAPWTINEDVLREVVEGNICYDETDPETAYLENLRMSQPSLDIILEATELGRYKKPVVTLAPFSQTGALPDSGRIPRIVNILQLSCTGLDWY